jgi:hypothetical protein
MRDLEELRGVLDDAASAIAQAVNAILKARESTPVLGYEVGAGFVESDDDRDLRVERIGTAHQKTFSLGLEAQRLRLRFGPDHPVSTSFWSARNGLVELIQAIDVEAELWTDEQSGLVDGLLAPAAELNGAFITACRKYTAVAEAP